MRQAPWARKLIRQIDRFTKLTNMEAVTTRTGFKVVTGDKGQVSMSFCGFQEVEKVKDDFNNLYMWLWNCKDYLIERVAAGSRAPGCTKRTVEEFAKTDPDLMIVADVANTVKHCKLKNTRTGRYARIGGFVTSMPILLGTEDSKAVKRRVREDSKAYIAVEARDGEQLGDAAEIASRAMSAWERFVRKHGLRR